MRFVKLGVAGSLATMALQNLFAAFKIPLSILSLDFLDTRLAGVTKPAV